MQEMLSSSHGNIFNKIFSIDLKENAVNKKKSEIL